MEKKKMDGGREKFQAKVIEILGQVLDIDVAQIKPTSQIIDDLGADDLATVEIILAFEEQFEMDIPDADMFPQGAVGFGTVQSLLDYFDKRIEFT